MRFDVRRTVMALTAIAALSASPAAATPDLTMADCQTLLSGLTALDGRQELTKDGTAVLVPYQFGNAALRLAIQQNIAALQAVMADFTKVQQGIFREIAGPDVAEIRPGTPELGRYQKQLAEALQVRCPAKLSRIKAGDLRLDRNEIPGSVLGAIDKILDR